VEQVEVAIVGGGPAGISAALFLAHAAPELTDRIVVLEKEHYPREKYCAGGVGARADNLLGSIGVQIDVPSVPLNGIAYRAAGQERVVRDPVGGPIGRVVRRIEFDHELARTAVRRGIRVLEGARVLGVRVSPEGVELESACGALRARAIVAADGVASVVRRELGIGAGCYQAQALELDTEPVASDVDRDLMLFDISRRSLTGYYWDFPTIVGGRELVCRGVYLLRRSGEGSPVEIQSILAAELDARGLELSRYKKKRYAERGFDLHAPLSRPRVLLIGEAAGIDPVTGEGIAQAVQYGAVAGSYLARKLRARDLTFGDWRDEVMTTMIGHDLAVRTLGVEAFYGAHRPHVERFLLDTPEFVRLGIQHFAGKRWAVSTIASATSGAARHIARWLLAGRPADVPPTPELGRQSFEVA
jgi:menaquinone-9 beta-reductase